MTDQAIDLHHKLTLFNDPWSPRTVTKLQIDLPDGTVTLEPEQMFIVPKGVQCRPRAGGEVHVLLIEPTGTANSGDVQTAAPRRVI
jgi:hypothetical protein